MSMNDGISILLAIFVIVLIIRWLLGTTPPPSTNNRRGINLTQEQPRRVRPVTAEMIETVCAMFPNIPPAAIQFDLQKTGSVEVTCDNILRDGGLPLPPPPVTPAAPIPSTSSPSSSATASSSIANNSSLTQQSLVHRYKLHEAVASDTVPDEPPRQWEATADKRHELLQKRKEAMVLQARKRYLEQQNKKQDNSPSQSQISFPSTNFQFMPSTKILQSNEPEVDAEEQITPEARRQQILQATELRMGFGSGKKS
ncbi:hypothetical protein G9A89_011237 [Geosiphon pyriformis]|nr:hypothetical protein G9A89_011237 [Geosiphon pyriformis]